MHVEARDSSTKKNRGLAVTSSTAGGSAGLTDDLIVEILSRVPVKSICRFKCASSSWRNLISHPDNRKKLPHRLTGFFYFHHEFDTGRFVGLAEPPRRTARCLRPPSPCGFLPADTVREDLGLDVVDCCNGLVLLINYHDGSGSPMLLSARRGCTPSYVVCNPATDKWTSVPGSARANIFTASIMCFDPAISPHFHVIELLEPEPGEDDWYANPETSRRFKGFNIYSSEIGAWVFHPHSYWSPVARRRTYFNGLLYCITDVSGAVAVLDMQGRTRRVIPTPRGVEVGLIGHSQGRLLYANRDTCRSSKLSVYELGEGENGKWTLKHRVDTTGMFADSREYLRSRRLVGAAALHLHCNSVFLFDSLQGRLMSYNMDSQRGHGIRTVKKSHMCYESLVPYVLLYLETAALENSSPMSFTMYRLCP